MLRATWLAAGFVVWLTLGSIAWSDEPEAPSAGRESPSEAAAAAENPADKSTQQIVAQVRDSIVVITQTGRDGKRAGLGTGFVISPDGLIATNLHVIGEARPISVEMADGTRHAVTSIHATERTNDLAIIRIDATELPALELGDSDTIAQGQAVVAVGNPHGLSHSVVAGVVSGTRVIDHTPMLQLAIPVESGNSGGPVLDMHGRVQGIMTLKSAVTENLGFAVAINALKPLVERPNPMEISRWLNLGTLDSQDWTTLFGARWRQRAGRILVDGAGEGFGGRALSLATLEVPQPPFEVAVSVRQKQQDGAAGLVFHADGQSKHYGFYPSNGALRLSRFDGPTVYSWQVLHEVQSTHYHPDEWNRLKVRVSDGKIECFVNDELVITSDDAVYQGGKVGLAKFRETEAEFKGFRLAPKIPSELPSADRAHNIAALVTDIPIDRPPTQQLIESLSAEGAAGPAVLRRRAQDLEAQARRLVQLADGVHQRDVLQHLAKLLESGADNVDLLRGALLIARLDNADVDVDGYVNEVEQMAADVQCRLDQQADADTRLKALNTYLFEELGFHGSRSDYYNKANSYFNDVLDDREGLPITLSILYIELARRIGLNVVGVGLPGHFVVRHEPQEGDHQLIDPFDRGRFVPHAEAVENVEAATGQKFEQSYLATQTNRAILVRMLRNLIGIAREARDPEAMLRYEDAVLTLLPESATDRWLRAVLCYNTDRNNEALAEADWLLEHQSAEVDLNEVRRFKQILLDEQR
jgi:regulator of sirC expression with transglutaminase-like and TPR domain